MNYRNLNELYQIMGNDFASNPNQTLNEYMVSVSPTSNAALVINFLKDKGVSGSLKIRSLIYSDQYENLIADAIRLVNSVTSVERFNSISDDYNLYINPKLTSGGGYTEVTYNELTSSISSNSLTPGSFYLITDFKTCYDRPDYDQLRNPISASTSSYAEGPVEPILVLATSTDTLAIDAYQPTHPNDKIKYDITWDTTESGEPAFGRIIERIDEWANRTDYDHRNIEFKRYQWYYHSLEFKEPGVVELIGDGTLNGSGTTFTNYSTGQVVAVTGTVERFFRITDITSDTLMTVTGTSISSFGGFGDFYIANSASYDSFHRNNVDAVDDFELYKTFGENNEVEAFGNYIGDYSRFHIEMVAGDFLLANNVFKDGPYRGNTIGNISYNNTFNDDCTNNVIGNRFFNNIIDDDFDRNFILDYFNNNVIRANFQYNQIGDNFEENIINNSAFYRNVIGNDFNNNWLDSDWGFSFQNNQIGNQFNNNQIFRDFYKNKILNGYNRNIVYREFYGNDLGNAFNNNNIYQEFYDNRIKDYFENNEIGDVNNIGNGYFEYNVVGNNFKGNLTIGEFMSNQIGNNFTANQVDYFFGYNTIENNFLANNISYNFAYNKIRNGFRFNTIANDFGFGGGDARGNVIGNNFNDNTIGEYFYDNTIGDNFASNTVGDDFINNQTSYSFTNNIIGNLFQQNEIRVSNIGSINFSAATHVYGDYTCQIFKRPDGSLKLSYYDNSNVLTITDINL